MPNEINGAEILITGGTGTLGKALTNVLLQEYKPKGIRLFSRGEYLQWQFKQELKQQGYENAPIAFLIGDVRDKHRVERAMRGIDIVIHTAAMKHIDVCERHPMEAIKTNVHGAENIINAAIDNNVKKIMNISTDKAVYPINLYGMTKAAAEKLFINGSVYSGGRIKMSCCRYGNVLNSRGSVIPLFINQYKDIGKITITHKLMSRYFIPIDSVVFFILTNIDTMKGGEIFVPKMKSAFLIDVAKWTVPHAKIEEIGIRQGEKLHECLITQEESGMIEEDAFKWTIFPTEKSKYNWYDRKEYNSNTNLYWWKEGEIDIYMKEFYEKNI